MNVCHIVQREVYTLESSLCEGTSHLPHYLFLRFETENMMKFKYELGRESEIVCVCVCVTVGNINAADFINMEYV